MRAILAFAILLLGLSGAAPEPEYSRFAADIRTHHDTLVEIESSTGRGDRLSLAALGPRVLRLELLRPRDRGTQLHFASIGSELGGESMDTQADPPVTPPQRASLDNLCNTLFSSAQDNDLPVPFFANLLWQESRLRVDDVSKKGAQGIAQFMPKTAVETGLADPFDPMQAIPASARFLQRLHLQFGNLGFVAAAYNAGAHRVIEWLERRASLPRETRDYVVRVTGLSVEAWKTMPVENSALTFVRHLPCRSLPAFANVEQEQLQQSESERAKRAAAPDEQTPKLGMADQLTIRAAPRQSHESKHPLVREARQSAHKSQSSKLASKREPKRDGSQIARETQASKREPKHDSSQTAREAQTSKREAKHEGSQLTHEALASRREASHLARSGRGTSKHEAAHAPRGRERHRSA